MKPWLWVVLGVLALFAVVVLFSIYRAFTVKIASPSHSPLAQAVFDEDADKVRTLLNEGSDANSPMSMTYHIAPDGNMSTSFDVPIFGGTQSKAGMSVLAYASMQGRTEIIRLLVDKGANVNSQDAYGQTPLILAAWNGDAATIQLLLSYHADMNAHDQSVKTALMWARAEGHNTVVDVLKTAGAKE